MVDSRVLVFANALPQTYSGQISGSGSLTKFDASLLVLTGSDSYSGGTTVNTDPNAHFRD